VSSAKLANSDALRPSSRGELAGKHMFFFLLYSLIEQGLIRRASLGVPKEAIICRAKIEKNFKHSVKKFVPGQLCEVKGSKIG
jgi:hypothetical protein